jgi:hypothetical protein
MTENSNADLKVIIEALTKDIEALKSSIDQKLTNNTNLDEKDRKIGPYINDTISKLLFTVKTFGK